MDVLERIKNGERIMVNLPSRAGCERTYNLTDGTAVSREQFAKIERFLTPGDMGLLGDSEPQSYEWSA